MLKPFSGNRGNHFYFLLQFSSGSSMFSGLFKSACTVFVFQWMQPFRAWISLSIPTWVPQPTSRPNFSGRSFYRVLWITSPSKIPTSLVSIFIAICGSNDFKFFRPSVIFVFFSCTDDCLIREEWALKKRKRCEMPTRLIYQRNVKFF